jgi:outer membrane protein OmpA-like peptidoglycan-associated protein
MRNRNRTGKKGGRVAVLAVLALLVVAPVAAQQAARVVLDEATGMMTLTLDVVAGSVEGSDGRLTMTPVLEGDAGTLYFPPVITEGRRARISRERGERSGIVTTPEGARFLSPGERLVYTATLPAGEWSGEARLTTRSVSERCGCEVAVPATAGVAAPLVMTVNIERVNAVAPAVVVEREVAPVVGQATRSTVARVAAPYTFVAPSTPAVRGLLAGGGTRLEVERYIDEHRDESLTVHFRVNSTVIEPSLGDNARVLEELVEALRALVDAPGKPRVGVLVGGFASPEGSSLLNDRLATERATAVREFIASRTSLTVSDIRVHGGGADWRGLRELVAASGMPWRSEVLRVIDTYPVWNPATQVGRLTTLQRLRGGEPYRYMLREFFPRLRNAAFIRVFYEEL